MIKVGEIYGRLTVIEVPLPISSIKSIFRCECGNIVRRWGYQVLRSDNSSCNRGKCAHSFVDLYGRKFGALTVLEVAKFEQEHSVWKCKCDCNKIVEVIGSCLTSGNNKSCGCRIQVRKSIEYLGPKDLYNNYKSNAKTRGHTFDLTREDFESFLKQSCYYCGRTESNSFLNRKTGETYLYNGIDRMDNSIGYVLENCVACCSDCNYAKRTKSANDFIQWAFQITEHQNRNGH